jgi:hypothetical protein
VEEMRKIFEKEVEGEEVRRRGFLTGEDKEDERNESRLGVDY